MNYRIIYTVGLSVVFISLVLTGILMYATEYDYFTAGLHLWSSVIVLVAVGGHFYNNWKPYKSHLKKSVGKRAFLGVGLSVGIISWGIMAEHVPFVTLISLGENIRGSSEVKDGEYMLIDLAPSTDDSQKLSLFIKAGSEYESEPQPLYWGLTYTAVPQIAVWLEDNNGNYISTLYVTGKAATSGFYSAVDGEGRVRRPETLPYWSHKRGVRAEDGLFVPAEDSTEFDGSTAATPKSDHLLLLNAKVLEGYKVMAEVNRSYDFNEFYHKQRFPNDAVYSGSGSSGQPSLVYGGDISFEQGNSTMLRLMGHGHHSGKNGELYADLSEITTAKKIVDFMVLNVHL